MLVKRISMIAALAMALLSVVRTSSAAISGPYTADANTIYLYHLNEAAGASSAANSGSAGFAAISYDGDPFAGDGVNQPTVTNVLGSPGFSGFGNAANMAALNGTSTAGRVGLGVDMSGDAAFLLDDGSPVTTDRLADSTSILGAGPNFPFTLEAMLNLPSITSGNREIIATDNSLATASRGFQFRITATGNIEFNWIGSGAASFNNIAIPTTGPDAFVANEWFHVALSFDGTNNNVYWTRVDPSRTQANLIGTNTVERPDSADPLSLVIGNEGRVVGTAGSQEGLNGLIDEVRISNVARGAGDFIFVPEPSTIVLCMLGAMGLLGVARTRRK